MATIWFFWGQQFWRFFSLSKKQWSDESNIFKSHRNDFLLLVAVGKLDLFQHRLLWCVLIWECHRGISNRMGGASITQWISLHLPFCHPGFESQAHHLCFNHLKSNFWYICHVKRLKINKKEARFGSFCKNVTGQCKDIRYGTTSRR